MRRWRAATIVPLSPSHFLIFYFTSTSHLPTLTGLEWYSNPAIRNCQCACWPENGFKQYLWVWITSLSSATAGCNLCGWCSTDELGLLLWKMRKIDIITKFVESTLKIEDFCTVNNNNSFIVVGEIKLCESTKTGHDCQFFDFDMHFIHPVYRHTKGDDAGKKKTYLLVKM